MGSTDYLLHHSQLKLNAEMGLCRAPEPVDRGRRPGSDRYPHRSRHIDLAQTSYRRAAGRAGDPHDGPGTATTATEDTAEDAERGKYRLLWQWLQDQGRDEINSPFANIEQVLGISLPHSARRHLTHWYGSEGTALGRAIRDMDGALTGSTLPMRP